jgi:hypothetical protein
MICRVCKGTGKYIEYYSANDIVGHSVNCTPCNGTGHKLPKVLNKRTTGVPSDAVYVGRGSRWGNPFEIGKHGTRDEVIDKYIAEFKSNPQNIIDAKMILKDRDLVCYCKPERCHADFLLEIANEM